MEDNTWTTFKQKKTEHFEKELEVFIDKLERIRSNRISLEVIRGLMVDYQRERRPLKAIANLKISPNHELVVQAFEPKMTALISKTILDNQLGYKIERSTKEEVYFTLAPITLETKNELIKKVKIIAESGKGTFRLLHQDINNALKKDKNISQDQKRNYEKQGNKLFKDYQDKLLAAAEKKIKELSS